MAKRKNKKKRKKRGRDDEMIVEGQSKIGDFLLDLVYYVKAYKMKHGSDPFEGLPEKRHREELIDAMRVSAAHEGLTAEHNFEAYDQMFQNFKRAIINNPNTPPEQRIGDLFQSKARSILDAHPELKGMLESDPGLVGAMHQASEIFRLPGPQSIKSPRVTAGRELIVDLYHRTLGIVRERQATIFGNKIDLEHREIVGQMNSRIWALLNESNIFEIKTELYENLKSTAVAHLCVRAGIEVMSEFKNPVPGDPDKFLDTLLEQSELQEMPEHFPFDTLYFAMDRPLQMSELEATRFFGVPERLRDGVWVYAFLVTRKEAYTLAIIDDKDKGASTVSAMPEFGHYLSEKKWGIPLSFNAFIFPWLIEWVNGHQTTINETKKFSYRRFYKKSASRYGITKPIPRPFYTVYIKDEMLDDFQREKTTKVRKKCEHQYSVRGTWVCRIARGPLPLDPKLEKQLRRDKRRKIFTIDKPDPDTAEHLSKRGVTPKRVDEWMSVLLYWRSDHRRGPKDGPYIPSIRKSARDKEAA
jgi:hypothetical protein